jgi:hypothetical protein
VREPEHIDGCKYGRANTGREQLQQILKENARDLVQDHRALRLA